jgi:adenosine kinase
VPAAKAKTVLDPTGAGDAYRAGLLYGLTEGQDMEIACRIGAVCAAYCVEQHGTQEHNFDLDTCKERYGQAFGSTW